MEHEIDGTQCYDGVMIKTYLVVYYFLNAFSFNSIYDITNIITAIQGQGFTFHDPYNRFH